MYGDSQDRVKRISFGLGQAPSPAAAEKCLRCSFGNVPVIEEVVWTIPLAAGGGGGDGHVR